MPVRAIHRAVTVEAVRPPYNVITLKVFYPAFWSDEPAARASGVMPPNTDRAPFPMVIFFPGVNCESHMYHWLAEEIAAEGFAVAVMSWVGMNFPGRVSLTPGIDLARLTPECYETGFTASSLPALLQSLEEMNTGSVLAGALDLDRIVLAGHSAGGTLALQNAVRDWLPGIAATVAYCANPLATTALGNFPAGVLQPLPGDAPTLMIGATEDGIGTHHNTVYGRPNRSGAQTILDTFEEAFPRTNKDSYGVILRGANHYTIAYPLDQTSGRAFFDTPETGDNAALRQMISALMRQFLGGVVLKTYKPLDNLLESSDLIADFRHK